MLSKGCETSFIGLCMRFKLQNRKKHIYKMHKLKRQNLSDYAVKYSEIVLCRIWLPHYELKNKMSPNDWSYWQLLKKICKLFTNSYFIFAELFRYVWLLHRNERVPKRFWNSFVKCYKLYSIYCPIYLHSRFKNILVFMCVPINQSMWHVWKILDRNTSWGGMCFLFISSFIFTFYWKHLIVTQHC